MDLVGNCFISWDCLYILKVYIMDCIFCHKENIVTDIVYEDKLQNNCRNNLEQDLQKEIFVICVNFMSVFKIGTQ